MLTIFVLVTILVLSRPLLYFPDSPAYYNMHIIRTPGYPLFISILKMISFGYFEFICKLIQLLLGLYAVRFFVNTIKRTIPMQPNGLLLLVLTLVLLLPYVRDLNIANRLLSEALSYPLYLIVVARFISAYIEKDPKQLLKSLPILFLLLLTRSQFLFFVPFGIAIIWVISGKKELFRNHLVLTLALVLLPIITSLTDRTYHYFANGHFISTPWTSTHMMSMAMFVSDKEDAALFDSQDEQRYFNDVYDELAKKNLQKNHLDPKSKRGLEQTYRANYSEIIVQTVVRHGIKTFYPDRTDASEEDYVLIENTAKSMTLPLIFDNFKSWIKLYSKNFISGFGGNGLALMYLVIMAFGLLYLRKLKEPNVKLIFFISCVTVANMALIALGPHTIKRLTFYNDWVLLFIIFWIINEIHKVSSKTAK